MRAANRVAVSLGQAIDGCFTQRRCGVDFAIPLFPDSDITEAKIRRQIHHANTLGKQGGHLAHGNIMRRGKEHDVTLCVIRLRGIGKAKITDSQKAWKQIIDAPARLTARGDDF